MKSSSAILLAAMLCLGSACLAQEKGSVTIVDFVKITEGRSKEAAYYYSNNWMVYRRIAQENGFIKSYRILKTQPDSVLTFDLILMTEYADSTQMNLAEDRFRKIIDELRPKGPLLLNELPAAGFRKSVGLKTATGIDP